MKNKVDKHTVNGRIYFTFLYCVIFYNFDAPFKNVYTLEVTPYPEGNNILIASYSANIYTLWLAVCAPSLNTLIYAHITNYFGDCSL